MGLKNWTTSHKRLPSKLFVLHLSQASIRSSVQRRLQDSDVCHALYQKTLICHFWSGCWPTGQGRPRLSFQTLLVVWVCYMSQGAENYSRMVGQKAGQALSFGRPLQKAELQLLAQLL